jgi:hypothetical protein
MKVTLLNRPTLYTDYHKKWLYCLTGSVSYLIEGVKIPTCDVYSDMQLDRLLKASMSHNKTPRKWLVYSGVRLFGWACYGSENITIKKL